jgi:phosphoribosylformylglycinamidine (FGAM) synthase PurS component
MTHRIEVAVREGLVDPREDGVLAGIHDLGITGVNRVFVADVYWLDATLSEAQLLSVATRLLSDPVAQVCGYDGAHVRGFEPCRCALEVAYNRGVTDPLEFTIL